MPGPFRGIDMAGNALRAFQRALDVTGHNISNINTPGYSRQTVDFGTLEPTTFQSMRRLALGNGVGIAAITRARDLFLEERAATNGSDLGRARTFAASLKEIEAVYGEPSDEGVAAALDKFFDAWSGLASNPNEPGMRLEVRQAGQDLADRIRGAWRTFDQTREQYREGATATIGRVNELAQEIATLNEQIRFQNVVDGQPNDLYDRRDLAVQELGKLVNVQTSFSDDGTLNVFLSQYTLVDRVGARPLGDTFDAATSTVTTNGQPITIRSGELRGLFESINQATTQMQRLDSLANSLRNQVNTIHKTISDPLDTSERFFNDTDPGDPQNGAVDFDLNAPIKADHNRIIAGQSGEAGDGGIALLLSQLRDNSIPTLGNRTFGAFYRDNLTELGALTMATEGRRSTLEAVGAQIDNQRQSISGVNLDEEMANLMRFQRSFQAAARALSVFDQTTEDLIGMLRR